MEVTSPVVDPEWHESNLLIQVMNAYAVPRGELFDLVRERQREKVVLGEKGITHRRGAYRYWLEELIRNQIAVESEGQPRLTALGRWIANSKAGTLDDRFRFVCNLVCLDCRKRHGRIVVLKLDERTAITNSKGRVFVDTQCPRCGRLEDRTGMLEGFSVGRFLRFYDQAVSELRKAVADMPEVVLPDSS